jgi:hypothetical protein
MSSSYIAFASARIFSLIWSKRSASGQQVRKKPLHAVDGPEEIHRRGARSGQTGADPLELGRKLRRCGGLRAQDAEGDAVSGRNADGRRAAHDHGDNHVGNLLVGGGEHIALLEGELRLIDETDAFRGPCKCRNHETPV